MLDEKGLMFPNGYHPFSQSFESDYGRVARPKRRREAKGIKYTIIDFGISSKYASEEDREFVYGCMAADLTVPELSDNLPYDPFPVDVYTLGNVYKNELLEVCYPFYSAVQN